MPARVVEQASLEVGRLKRDVDRQQLEFLRSLHFYWDDISVSFGRTLRRRAKEWHINTFSTIVDSELDDILGDLPPPGQSTASQSAC